MARREPPSSSSSSKPTGKPIIRKTTAKSKVGGEVRGQGAREKSDDGGSRSSEKAGRDDRGKRLLDLVVLLLGARSPVPFREMKQQFRAYRTEKDQAGLRAFERDKSDLLELGVPLRYVTPDEDDSVDEGGYIVDLRRYRLPEIHLTPAETAALVLAGSVARAAPGTTYAEVVDLALKKLAFDQPQAPDTPGSPVKRAEPVLVHFPRPKEAGQLAERLAQLEQAVSHHKRLLVTYTSSSSAQAIERAVDPAGLFYRRGRGPSSAGVTCATTCAPSASTGWSQLEVAPRPKTADYERPTDFDVRRYAGALAVAVPDRAGRRRRARGEAGGGGDRERRFRRRRATRDRGRSRRRGARDVSVRQPGVCRRAGPGREGWARDPGAGIAARAGARGVARAPRQVQADRPMNDLTARLRRLLFLVPYVAREQRHGVKLEQLGRELGIDRADLLADVDLLTQVGPPGGDPSEYLLVSVEDGKVFVDLPQRLTRPLRLTPAEGCSLLLGLRALRQSGIAPYDEALASAEAKLLRALGADAGAAVELADETVVAEPDRQVAANLRALINASRERQVVTIDYVAASTSAASRRGLEPYGIVQHNGEWYVVGRCQKRGDVRTFRVDRIVNLEPSEDRTSIRRRTSTWPSTGASGSSCPAPTRSGDRAPRRDRRESHRRGLAVRRGDPVARRRRRDRDAVRGVGVGDRLDARPRRARRDRRARGGQGRHARQDRGDARRVVT